MVTEMEKILRLSWANIRKHKLETVALVVLVTLCMLLMGSALEGIKGAKSIFPHLMEHTCRYENHILIPDEYYKEAFADILASDERVSDAAHTEVIYSMSTDYLDDEGKEQALTMCFSTGYSHEILELSEIETTLSDEEIAALEHPIYMPYAARDSMGYKAGDDFDMIFGTRRFSFVIAGFYDAILFDTPGIGLKMIVSDQDYHLLEGIIDKHTVLAYNDGQGKGGDKLLEDALREFDEYSNSNVSDNVMSALYKDLKEGITYNTDVLLKILVGMAVLIIIAVAIMIRFRIAGDIKDQIVNIGVLEAMGYTSKNITLSYVLEYLLITVAGIIIGTAGCLVVSPAFFRTGEIMSGHLSDSRITAKPLIVTAVIIIAFVTVISFLRARAVRKFPPVQAFRKGQGDHRFGREYFPLRKTKSSVHFRLAMKGFVQNFKQNLGLTVCITAASAAIVFCFIIFTFFSGGMSAISKSSGIELSDLRLSIINPTDTEWLAEELETLPEVRKATPTSGESIMINMPEKKQVLLPTAFTSFDVTENIFTSEGRYPQHDNEIMLTNMLGKLDGFSTGDSVTLEYGGVKRQYIITGFVTSLTNGGINLYIAEDGMKRLIPTYAPDTIELYLKDGVDADEFKYTLTERYGRSIADAGKAAEGEGSYEDRIRAEAEKQIADIIANQGGNHVEYAIQSGDTVIKGSSSGFIIGSVINLGGVIKTQLAGTAKAISALTTVLMLLSALVVMIILFILMETSIKRQRKEFGVMKSMGYTSRELMLQLAFRIMPAAFISVAVGTAFSVIAVKLFASFIGVIETNMAAVFFMDAVLLLFCFICAYAGARKIKKISVYELMTE